MEWREEKRVSEGERAKKRKGSVRCRRCSRIGPWRETLQRHSALYPDRKPRLKSVSLNGLGRRYKERNSLAIKAILSLLNRTQTCFFNRGLRFFFLGSYKK